MDLRLGRTVQRLERAGGAIRAHLDDGASLEVDQVLVATGRRPNVAGLGLESVGITLDGAGAIPVDAYSRTSVPSIYAVGDVTNRANLTPIAIREGHAEAISRPLHAGRSTIVVETEVRDATGELVAKVTQTQAVLLPR